MVALLYFVIFLSSCDPAPPPPPKKAVFIICDFTSSTKETKNNTDSILVVNANAVLKSLPANVIYSFYEVTEGAQPFFYKDSTGNSNNVYIDNLEKYGECIRTIKSKQSSVRPELTCIGNTLQSIKSQLEYTYNNPSNEKVYLIMLSDMLEACKWDTGNGKREMINLEEGKFREGMLTLEKWPGEEFFTSMPNLEIGIVLSGGKNVSFNNLELFWQTYFKKAGYSKKIRITTDVPDGFFK